MHWDFFTVLSVLSGIVLIAAGLAGPVVGTARERLGIFALGAFSFVYGIWVATQVSGFYMFSVAPAVLAIMIIIRAVRHAGQKKPPAGQPSSGTAALLPGTPSGTGRWREHTQRPLSQRLRNRRHSALRRRAPRRPAAPRYRHYGWLSPNGYAKPCTANRRPSAQSFSCRTRLSCRRRPEVRATT